MKFATNQTSTRQPRVLLAIFAALGLLATVFATSADATQSAQQTKRDLDLSATEGVSAGGATSVAPGDETNGFSNSYVVIDNLNDATTLPADAPAFFVPGHRPTTVSTVSAFDDATQMVPIGFSFDFYDKTYTDVIIDANGFLSFDTASGCCVNGDLATYRGRMAENGLLVGRNFPPMLDHNRLSFGLPNEMDRWASTIKDFRAKGWI